jgi:signal transduction histidine kinase
VSIDVERSDGLVVATVNDDGVGGADARRGSGLLGLSDRVAALGGTLEISSPPGAGTTIRALLPSG